MIRIHLDNPQKRIVDQIVVGLNKGEIFIIPTDTVYAMVCLSNAPRAISLIYTIRSIPEKKHLSLLCRDIAMASNFAKNISNPVFRFMRSVLPGPYTFILHANRNLDKRSTGKRREVGIRIIDHPLHKALMEQLEIPLLATSITSDDEYLTDPEELEQVYGHQVAVIDGGHRYHEFSTILDCTQDQIKIVREAKGPIRNMGLDHLIEN